MSTTKKSTSISAQQATKLSAAQIELLAKQAGISKEQLAKLKVDMSTKELVAYLLEKKQEIDEQLAQSDTDELVHTEDDVQVKEDKSIFDTEGTAENDVETAQNNTELASSEAADSGLNSGDELVDASMETIPMSSDYSQLLPASGAGQQSNGNKGFAPWQIGLGVLGVGVGVAALSGGGGGGSHGGSASNGGDTAASTTVNGQVALGMFYDGATVTAYSLDGDVIGSAVVENGQYTMSLTNGYTGAVYFILHDTNGTQTNFNNETTGKREDLGSVQLAALDFVANGINIVNITEASSFLYQLATDQLDDDTPEPTQEMIDNLTQAFINTLGFDPNTTTPVTVDSASWGQDGVTQAETDYGIFLALLSGVMAQQEDGLSGSSDLFDGKISYALNDDDEPVLVFSDELKAALYAGAIAYDASENGQNDGVDSLAKDLVNKLFNVDTSSAGGVYYEGIVRGGDNPTQINNAVGNTVSFIVSFSEAVSNFDENSITILNTNVDLDTSSFDTGFELVDLGNGTYRVVVYLTGDYVDGSVIINVDSDSVTDTEGAALVDVPDGVTVSFLNAYTIDIIKNRSAEDFVELSTAQINGLSNTQLAALIAEQLAAEVQDGSSVISLIADTKVALLNANALTALSTEFVQALTAGQVANLTQSQLEATSEDDEGNDVTLLAKLSVEQISAIDTDVLAALDGEALAALNVEMIHALTDEQVAVLTADQLSSKSAVYLLSKLDTDQVSLLTSDQLKLTAAVIQSMSDEQVNALTLAQLEFKNGSTSTSTTVYERLSDAQKEALPHASVTKFSADTGASAGDFDTNVAEQTVTGTYTNLGEGRTIEVRADDGDWTEVTLGEDGTWTAVLTLIEGADTQIQIRVKQGEATLEIEQQDYILDQTPPDAPVVTTEHEAVNTNTTDASVTFNVDDASVGFVIKISVNGEIVDTHTLTAAEINAGVYTTTLTGLSEAANTVTATITDMAGNESDPSAELTVTVDTTAPTIDFDNTSPADEGYVAESGNIVIAFNEKIKLGEQGTITLVDVTDSTKTQVISIPSEYLTVLDDGYTLVITPLSALVKGDQYYVNLSAAAVTDLAGNAFAGLSDDTSLNFTVSSLNIELGDFTDDNFINAFEYYDAIDSGDGLSATITATGDDNTLTALTSNDFSVAFEGTNLSTSDYTIEYLSAGSWLLTLTSDFLQTMDYVENPSITVSVTTQMDGDEVSASVTKTVTVDLYAPNSPTVEVDSSFTNNATVAVTVTATDAKVGDTIYVYAQYHDSLGTVDEALTSMLITEANFSESGEYIFDVGLSHGDGDYKLKSYLIDKAGNESYQASSEVITYDSTEPTLTSSSPADETMMTSSGNLTFTFSEAMLLAETGSITLVNVDDASETITIDINDSTQVTLSDDGTTLTVNPTNDLTMGASYTVSIDNGALTDKAGNDFTGTSITVSVADLAVSIARFGEDDDYIINADEADSLVQITGYVSGDSTILGSLNINDVQIRIGDSVYTPSSFAPVVTNPNRYIWNFYYDPSGTADIEDLILSVFVTAEVNNESVTASVETTFDIDTTPPSEPEISVNGALLTNDTSPEFTVDLSGTGAEEGDSLKLYRNNELVNTIVLTAAMIASQSASIASTEITGEDGEYTFSTTITDVAGNEGNASEITLTLDTSAPTLSTDAISGATGEVTVSFSEDISLADVSLISLLDGDGQIITLGTDAISVSGSTLTITSGSIVSGADYSVAIGSGALEDLAGNALAAVTTDEVTVVGAPSLTANQALASIDNLDVQSDLVLTYDQDISLLSGTLRIKADSATGWHVQTTNTDGIATSSGDVVLDIIDGVVMNMAVGASDEQGGISYDYTNVISIVGNKLVINLDSTGYDLDFASDYHIEMSAGLVGSTASEMTSEALTSTDSALTSFTTVTPASNTMGNASVKFSDSGSVEDSFIWISVHQSSTDAPAVTLDASGGEYALVQQTLGNLNTNTDFEGNVIVNGFTSDDIYYSDNFGDLSVVPTTEPTPSGMEGENDAFWQGTTRSQDTTGDNGPAPGLQVNFIDFEETFKDAEPFGYDPNEVNYLGDDEIERLMGVNNFVFG